MSWLIFILFMAPILAIFIGISLIDKSEPLEAAPKKITKNFQFDLIIALGSLVMIAPITIAGWLQEGQIWWLFPIGPSLLFYIIAWIVWRKVFRI